MTNTNPDQYPPITLNIGGSPVRSRAVELTGRVVTHQQLANSDFYNAVKGPLMLGDVDVIDQRGDRVVVDGEPLTFDDPRAARALAHSQEAWVGVDAGPRQLIADTLGVDWLTQQIRSGVQPGQTPQQAAQQARNATGDITGGI